MRRFLGAALLALAVPTAAAAQAPTLGTLLDTIAAEWARGDAVRLADHTAAAGVELEVEGETVGVITGRKLAATLRRVFESQNTVSVVPSMGESVAGAEHRAYAELRWELRSTGADVPERRTVFLGLVREGSSWRVSQIRILR